jgi:hypothetical protein
LDERRETTRLLIRQHLENRAGNSGTRASCRVTRALRRNLIHESHAASFTRAIEILRSRALETRIGLRGSLP